MVSLTSPVGASFGSGSGTAAGGADRAAAANRRRGLTRFSGPRHVGAWVGKLDVLSGNGRTSVAEIGDKDWRPQCALGVGSRRRCGSGVVGVALLESTSAVGYGDDSTVHVEFAVSLVVEPGPAGDIGTEHIYKAVVGGGGGRWGKLPSKQGVASRGVGGDGEAESLVALGIGFGAAADDGFDDLKRFAAIKGKRDLAGPAEVGCGAVEPGSAQLEGRGWRGQGRGGRRCSPKIVCPSGGVADDGPPAGGAEIDVIALAGVVGAGGRERREIIVVLVHFVGIGLVAQGGRVGHGHVGERVGGDEDQEEQNMHRTHCGVRVGLLRRAAYHICRIYEQEMGEGGGGGGGIY